MKDDCDTILVSKKRHFSTVFLALLLSACVSSSSGKIPKIDPSFVNCTGIQGVFRHASELTNNNLIGEALLKCGKNCTMGISKEDSAFALKYDAGQLHWALVHTPSQDIIAKGVSEMQCNQGTMSYQGAKDALGLVGKTRFMIALTINTKGQLVYYTKSETTGAFIGAPVPIFGSEAHISDPNIVSPDRKLQQKLDLLLNKEASTNKFTQAQEDKRLALAASKAKADKRAANEAQTRQKAKQKWIADQGSPNQTEITQGEPLVIDGIIFMLKDARYRSSPDGGISLSKATIIARKNEQKRTLYLNRNHLVNDLSYIPIFGKSIALRGVSAYQAPKTALLNLLNSHFEH